MIDVQKVIEARVVISITGHDEGGKGDGFDFVLTNCNGLCVHVGETQDQVVPLLGVGHQLSPGGEEVRGLFVERIGGEGEVVFEIGTRLSVDT